ncbi:hypothetical protein C8R44DRAFT_744226 [Mycena epipterygia]|nr:hypothetical protein C8R44DRAFT_744226 [Mycena epipterygia]
MLRTSIPIDIGEQPVDTGNHISSGPTPLPAGAASYSLRYIKLTRHAKENSVCTATFGFGSDRILLVSRIPAFFLDDIVLKENLKLLSREPCSSPNSASVHDGQLIGAIWIPEGIVHLYDPPCLVIAKAWKPMVQFSMEELESELEKQGVNLKAHKARILRAQERGKERRKRGEHERRRGCRDERIPQFHHQRLIVLPLLKNDRSSTKWKSESESDSPFQNPAKALTNLGRHQREDERCRQLRWQNEAGRLIPSRGTTRCDHRLLTRYIRLPNRPIRHSSVTHLGGAIVDHLPPLRFKRSSCQTESLVELQATRFGCSGRNLRAYALALLSLVMNCGRVFGYASPYTEDLFEVILATLGRSSTSPGSAHPQPSQIIFKPASPCPLASAGNHPEIFGLSKSTRHSEDERLWTQSQRQLPALDFADGHGRRGWVVQRAGTADV